jgi:2-methylaconitate cis-trans-isomerase PrpF
MHGPVCTKNAAMPQTAIPCLFMRGGTSRGPFFNAADLPADLPRATACCWP